MEVLLEYGSSKREFKLSKDEDVFQALEEAFQQFEPGLSFGISQQRDVKPTHFLQRYSEKWRDYIDVSHKGEISNGDKIRAVVRTEKDEENEKNVSQVLKRGSGACVGIKKPSESDSKVLRSLFPVSSASRSFQMKRKFNPLDDCVVSKQKQKKKATRIKPRNVMVVLMTEGDTSVPRGNKRKPMAQNGFIKQCELLRDMSRVEVENKLIKLFSEKISTKNAGVKFLIPDPKLHIVRETGDKELDGNDTIELAGQGSLYIRIKNRSKDENREVMKPDDVDDDDSDLPKVKWKKIENEEDETDKVVDLTSEDDTELTQESLEDWRKLRREQELQYEESLRVDQQKAQQQANDSDKVKRREEEKTKLQLYFSERTLPHVAVKLAVKLQDGTKIHGSFSADDSMKLVYQYVYAHTEVKTSFKLCTGAVPMEVLQPDEKSLAQYDLRASSLLLLEETPSNDDDKWIDELTHCKEAEIIQEVKGNISCTDILMKEENTRKEFVKTFRTPSKELYTVARSSLFDDVISLYKEYPGITNECPLEMKLKDELAVDLGGVSKDIVSGFWQEAYERLFDGSISFVPAVRPHVEFSLFEVLGKILSHGYFCTGFLPTQISFPTLAAMILGCQVQISPSILLESLFDYVSDVDRSVLSTALQFSKDNPNLKFPSQILDSLLNVFSHFQCRRVPDPLSLRLTLVDIARFVFLTNPMSAINAVNLAIPQSHVPFWKSKSISDLYKLYLALTATPFKVLSLLAEPKFLNASQETVFGYLQQFIGNMTRDQVKMFLRFVTGSSVCSTKEIEVQFNSLSGVARRPITHTCSNILELSMTYHSYSEFAKEFRLVMSDETYSWIMDGL